MFKKISKIFKYFLTFFILFITFYTIYKSEYVEDGFLRVTYIINYIIVILLIIYLIIFYFSKIENQKNLLIFFFTTTFILFLSEFFLQNYLINKKNNNIQIFLEKKKQTYHKNYNKKFDVRSKYEIYQNKKNEDYFLNITPSNYLGKNEKILPLSGISNSKIINCNENGYYSTYKSDNFGFNNFYKEWPKKIDYFLLGDSFINGSCVNENETITFNLIKNFDFKKKIINTGMAGNGTLLEYASFKEFSVDKEIKNLLLFYYEGNDMGNLLKEIKDPVLSKYFYNQNFSQNLIQKQNIIDNIHKKKFSIELKNKLENRKKIRILILYHF